MKWFKFLNNNHQDLDMLAQQLNQLGGSSAPAEPPLVEDDDSSDDDDQRTANDGTLLASDPPKPLWVAAMFGQWRHAIGLRPAQTAVSGCNCLTDGLWKSRRNASG